MFIMRMKLQKIVFERSTIEDPVVIRISCGSAKDKRTPRNKFLWHKDFGYTGGRSANATGTSKIAPQLNKIRYFSLSDGPKNCYNVTGLPQGHYTLRIFFGLNEDVLADQEPLFDISVEGTQVYVVKSGWSVNDKQSYVEMMVFVSDTAATVCFHSTGHGDPSIMSIEVLEVHPQAYYFGDIWVDLILRTLKRVNCGVQLSRFVEIGNLFWLSDSDVNKSGGRPIVTSRQIKNTPTAPNYYPVQIYESAARGSHVASSCINLVLV